MGTSREDSLSFMAGGGEMGSRIRAHDWAATPLGRPQHWPQGLKVMLRLLLSTGHPMFIWWGPDLIQFYNDAYRRSIGTERHPSALGQRGRECWEEIWPIIGPQIEQVMEGGGHTWHENQLVPITRDGRQEDVYWTYSYSPIDDPGALNGIGGVLVVCTETTMRVRAEQQLQTAEARWRRLFEQAPGFMCVLQGPGHVFEFANPRYFELIGKRQLIGKRLAEALPEVAAQGFVDLLDAVYQSGQAHIGLATPLVLSPGPAGPQQTVFVDFVYQPIRDAGGQVTGIFVEGSEVTDRVQAHEALRSADRRKDEFLATLAHELRNPLASLRNASVLLNRITTANPAMQAIGGVLERQVNQLTRLVDDLLDVARITQGRIELQRLPMALDAAVELAIETVQSLMREKNHVLEVAKSEAPLFVNGDLTRIAQCFVNILANAAKYTAPGGRIRIALRRAGDDGVVEITDNGSGISSETLPKIFDLFVQADQTLVHSQGGLGIGLSIVQKLVQMHGGSVRAHSAGLGQGSTFEVRFPLIESRLGEDAAAVAEAVTARSVLVVDDNVDAAESLAEVLRLDGHRVTVVFSGIEAIARAIEFPTDIILLDIGLPEMSGYDVVRQMRARGCRSTLIALSGYGRAGDVQRAFDAGFDAHLTKPVDFGRLRQLLMA